jgi:hypothetical protein
VTSFQIAMLISTWEAENWHLETGTGTGQLATGTWNWLLLLCPDS